MSKQNDINILLSTVFIHPEMMRTVPYVPSELKADKYNQVTYSYTPELKKEMERDFEKLEILDEVKLKFAHTIWKLWLITKMKKI